MRLTKELATKIVNKTMQVLGKNVNIMDEQGIIIGSGEEERIGTFHEISTRVISRGESVNIYASEAEEYKGVKAGINLPIKFNDKIIGVVGITGKVDEVSGYGKILKNLVELMLQQEFLLREFENEKKMRENLFQQLLSNSITDEEVLKDRLRLLDINPDLYRMVMVIKINPYDNDTITELMHKFENHYKFNNVEDIFFIRGSNLILIKSLETKNLQKQGQETLNFAREIKDYLNEKSSRISMGIGQIFSELKKLHLSYQGAKNALEVGKKIVNYDNNIYFINHLGIDYFLPSIECSSVNYFLEHLFDRDISSVFSSRNEIGLILEELVDSNLNLSEAARNLYMHRNTLLYKIDKIKKITGLDPSKLKDLMSLYWAYHLYLFYKSK